MSTGDKGSYFRCCSLGMISDARTRGGDGVNLTKRGMEKKQFFDQEVSNFVDNVEKIQLSRKSQKRREDSCNRLRLRVPRKRVKRMLGARCLV